MHPPEFKERETISCSNAVAIEPFVSKQILRILPLALSSAFLEVSME
jgi:hypothetical protein